MEIKQTFQGMCSESSAVRRSLEGHSENEPKRTCLVPDLGQETFFFLLYISADLIKGFCSIAAVNSSVKEGGEFKKVMCPLVNVTHRVFF